MKWKNKIVVATTITILSLTIMFTYLRGDLSNQSHHSQGNQTPQSSHRVVTPPASFEYQISQMLSKEKDQSSTQNETTTEGLAEKIISAVPPTETIPTQPTTEETLDSTTTPDTQMTTKPTTLPPIEPATPKMGDARIVDGNQQSYFLGFGWVDYMGENECIFEEGMYENGNKVGIMD